MKLRSLISADVWIAGIAYWFASHNLLILTPQDSACMTEPRSHLKSMFAWAFRISWRFTIGDVVVLSWSKMDRSILEQLDIVGKNNYSSQVACENKKKKKRRLFGQTVKAKHQYIWSNPETWYYFICLCICGQTNSFDWFALFHPCVCA